MMILTANRNMKEKDSLEQVMQKENTSTSFPVITISDLTRLDEFEYRERCVDRLVEIILFRWKIIWEWVGFLFHRW